MRTNHGRSTNFWRRSQNEKGGVGADGHGSRALVDVLRRAIRSRLLALAEWGGCDCDEGSATAGICVIPLTNRGRAVQGGSSPWS